MAIVLGPTQYGKAENRVVRIYRDTPRHEIKDVTVSTALRGDFTDAHTVGDQARIVPTDSQKHACYAFAKTHGIDQIETYALALGRHFVASIEPVDAARISVDEHRWQRVEDHDHTWVRAGEETRTTAVTVEVGTAGAGAGGSEAAGIETPGPRAWVVSGFKDLALLKSTGSQFWGFLEDEYTVLEPTTDRVMATSLQAWWRYATTDVDYGAVYGNVKALMMRTYAELESLALQQTLYAMGSAVLEAHPEIAEVRLSAPNNHHLLYDLDRFGIANAGEVFHADDRPYGLIQAAVTRDDAPPPGPAWDEFPRT
ncbi:urate oxidase [Actinobacteria bacterium YIM 96077]|uniref:Uricase n=1 Tax=Phytoactinopolyspora halophila TaxID=1981511 RepID=A0A329R163_9ACTN|nr:urate oxidase [Phytoactinopolyspora halophila]AYY11632.1 urate oxidase [Actinobacteria bacterium YIM 96077]RAW17936.1 urate oxidase [Phytoactinopolyspora halophila]